MSDEQKPHVIVGIYAINKNGEILFIKSPKWGDRLIPPGGHVEYGENLEEAVKREMKEETGLDVKNVEFIFAGDLIEPTEWTGDKRHFIYLDHKAELVDENQPVVLEKIEASDYVWLKPEEVVKRDDMEASSKKVIQNYFLKPKKSFFKKSNQDCEKYIKEIEEFKNNWQRALADYKNLQRETSERRGEWARMSEQQILEDFIPVYDNFKKAFSHHPELSEDQKQMKNWTDGIGYIMKQFWDILKAHSVEEIKTVGEKFDPRFHEAAGEEAVEGKEPGTILKEVDGGYKMGDKVIKPAKVIISK